MSKLRISLPEINPLGRLLRTQASTDCVCILVGFLPGIVSSRCFLAAGRRCNLQGARKHTVTTMLCASLVALTGCATTAELEYLRAEVAKANAVASRAQASVSRAERELAAMRKAYEAPELPSEPSSPPTINSPRIGGYKWGKLQ
jgi:hypothetical protein